MKGDRQFSLMRNSCRGYSIFLYPTAALMSWDRFHFAAGRAQAGKLATRQCRKLEAYETGTEPCRVSNELSRLQHFATQMHAGTGVISHNSRANHGRQKKSRPLNRADNRVGCGRAKAALNARD